MSSKTIICLSYKTATKISLKELVTTSSIRVSVENLNPKIELDIFNDEMTIVVNNMRVM